MKPENRKIDEDLKRSVDRLDGIEAPKPDFGYFKNLVDREQARLRRAQRRQLALFVAVAAALVSGLIFCIGNYQVVFIALQCAAILGAAAGLVWFFARRPKEGSAQ